MSASFLIEDLVSKSTQKVIGFIKSRCLRRRLNSCECDNCLSCCPADAIVIHNNQVKLDRGKCTGCMLCSTVCPNDAFEFPLADIEKYIFAKEKRELIVISCSRQKQVYPEEHVIPCLGSLSLEHLLVLGLAGSPVTAFNTMACYNCENRTAADSFLSILTEFQEQAGNLLNTTFIVISEPEEITSIPHESRRSYISGLKSNLLTAISPQVTYSSADTDDNVIKSRRIPKSIYLKRYLSTHVDEERKQLISSLSDYSVEISEGCTPCPLCKGICPTGAIKVDRSDGEKKILIDNSLCSGCRLCVLFCKKEAITLHPPLRSGVSTNTNRDKYLFESPD